MSLDSKLFEPTKLKAPFGWVGGKSRLAKEIVSMMPEHKLYVEVFGGGLSVLYAKPKKAKLSEVVNDINGELVNLHRTIKNYPETFSNKLADLLISREIFNDILKGNLKPKGKIEEAVFYYYRLRYSFGGRGEAFGTSKRREPKVLYKDFRIWSQRLKQVCIENLSFDRLIKEYDWEQALFYLDPPYIGTEFHYKKSFDFGEKEHELWLKFLKGLKESLF